MGRPAFEDRGDEGPRRFDLIAAGEKGLVALQGVEKQPLVSLRRLDTERRAVVEIHLYGLDPQRRSRDLGTELKRDALVRLDAHGDDVWRKRVAAVAVEQDARHLPELDRDLGRALRHPLAR